MLAKVIEKLRNMHHACVGLLQNIYNIYVFQENIKCWGSTAFDCDPKLCGTQIPQQMKKNCKTYMKVMFILQRKKLN